MVQMIVIPLLVASIILVITSSRNVQQLRGMGLHTALFFLFTTVVPLFWAAAWAVTVKSPYKGRKNGA